jgi:hypothetical protein
MTSRYDQIGTAQEQVRPNKLASRLQFSTQLLHEEKAPPSEENTREDREELAMWTLPGQNSKKILHWTRSFY